MKIIIHLTSFVDQHTIKLLCNNDVVDHYWGADKDRTLQENIFKTDNNFICFTYFDYLSNCERCKELSSLNLSENTKA